MTMRKQQLAAQTQLVRRESMLRLARRFASESDAEQVLTDLLPKRSPCSAATAAR